MEGAGGGERFFALFPIYFCHTFGFSPPSLPPFLRLDPRRKIPAAAQNITTWSRKKKTKGKGRLGVGGRGCCEPKNQIRLGGGGTEAGRCKKRKEEEEKTKLCCLFFTAVVGRRRHESSLPPVPGSWVGGTGGGRSSILSIV